ncbi:hypothetical protein VTK73DRAFT_9363 [Phialemonium thermophilum]|uniref:AB hydrolase-1 domain-containing protein n=1 Tax=Phialemonium thermophilum TaxID=223376 RepID=A0ABR3W300_9PEZI
MPWPPSWLKERVGPRWKGWKKGREGVASVDAPPARPGKKKGLPTASSRTHARGTRAATAGSTQTPASEDPLGLTVVYQPPGAPVADVVFVHGLGGSSRRTWCHNRDLELFWPARFLPLEPVVGAARILTFGYNAGFGPGSAKSRIAILDFAQELLYELKFARDRSTPESGSGSLGIGERPIIFVMHSMGGLVVKEAYLCGKDNPTYRSLVQAVSAMVFLSTPHRGTDKAETLGRLLQALLSNPKVFVAELASGSRTLDGLNERFRHVAPDLQIVSFYETRPTPILRSSMAFSWLLAAGAYSSPRFCRRR